MSATITDTTVIGNENIRFQYSGTAPFDVYGNDGEALLTQTSATEITVYYDDDVLQEGPIIEVLDSTQSSETPTTQAHPGYAVLQWRGKVAAHYYRIEVYNGAAWVDASTYESYPRHDGRAYYQWRTPMLDHGTTKQYRVIPVQEVEGVVYDGDAVEFTVTIYRYPESPEYSKSDADPDIDAVIEWDSVGEQITIDAP